MPDDDDDYESAFSLDGITDQESVSKNNWIGPDGTGVAQMSLKIGI